MTSRAGWSRLPERERRLLRGSAGSFGLRGASLVLRFAAGIAVAQVLGAAGYGVYAYAIAWMSIVAIPASLGLDHMLLRYVAQYKAEGAWHRMLGVVRYAGRVGVLSGFLVTTAALVAIAAWPGLADRVVFGAAFLVLPLVVLASVRQGTLRGLDRPLLAHLPDNLVYPATFLLLVVGMAGLQPAWVSPFAVAVANGAAWVTAFVVGTLLVRRARPPELAGVEASGHPADWFAMVPALVLSSTAFYALSRADLLILGLFASPEDVGIYAVASRASEVMLFPYDAVTLAGSALFAALATKGDRSEMQRLATIATRIILVAGLPVCLGLLAFAPGFLGFFGSGFVAGEGVVRILATTTYLSTLGGFVIPILYVTGGHRVVAAVVVGAALANVVLSFLLIPPLGIVGAALAAGTSLLGLKAALVVGIWRRLRIVSLPLGRGADGRA